MRVQILHNPASGRCSPRLTARLAAAFARRGAAVTLTETGRGPPEIAADADHLCVVGGDGTLRHVAHALAAMAEPPPMSAFPGGTVNLLAREWDGGRCAETFAARVLARTERSHLPVHLGDDGLFLVCAGAGWESAAVAAVSPRLKRWIGRAAYALSALRLFVRWRAPRIRLIADEREVICGGFHIAKGAHYAGPWRLAARAMGAEPLMHVVALTRAGRRDLLRFWWTLARGGTVAALPHVEAFDCAVLEVEIEGEAGGAWPVQADGDVVGALPMRFRVAERAVRMC